MIVPLLTLLLAGCSGSNGGANSESATLPTATGRDPTPASTPVNVPQTRVTLANAWGSVTIHYLPTAVDDLHVFIFDNAATPDGEWLVGHITRRDVFNNSTELPRMVLYNVATKQFVTMHQMLHPQSQVIGASADDQWVVWSEADDQPNFFDWTMFAYNRQTGVVKLLAQAATANGQPVPGPAPYPIVDNNQVVWGQAIGPVSKQTIDNAVVRKEDLGTGQFTTLATKAGSPIYQWPWVIWGQVTGGGGYENIENLQTGQQSKLQVQAASLALAGNSLAYNDSNLTHAYLIDDFTSSPWQTKMLIDLMGGDEAEHVQFVTLSDRLVAWDEDAATEVWDRKQQVFVQLPVSSGHPGTWVGGRTLVWIDPESPEQQQQDRKNNLIPNGTIDVVDTSTLPTTPAHG